MIFLLLLVGAKGLLSNLNHTHGASIEERLDLLEKQLADEKRQRYMLQIEYDQEKETVKQLKHQHDTMNDTVQKHFQDISTQIRGALLSINTLETNFGADNQNLLDALKAVQTNVANLTLNQSESQRNLEEKENILSLMIYAMRYNQSLDREEVTHLKANVTNMDNKQRKLQSTVNANANTQISLQSQISKIKDVVLFLSIPRESLHLMYVTIYPQATKGTTISFPRTKMNVGGGYDHNTGVFTCPSDGYYVFHWRVTSSDINKRCSSAIVKNGAEVIGNEFGGNQATFDMNRNDRAWIKATSDCSIVPNYSSFSGFKLI